MKKMKMPKMKMPKMSAKSDMDGDEGMPAYKKGGHVTMGGKGHGHSEMASATKNGHKPMHRA